jgi:hypothetical protein
VVINTSDWIGNDAVLIQGINTADYITHDDADDYFDTRLNATAWTAAGVSDADKESALHMATQAINCLGLKGWKANPETQVNQFPRYIPLARGGIMGDGITVPQAVIDACCEEALELLATGGNVRRSLQDQGVTSMKMLDVSETFGTPAGQPVLISRIAMNLMRPFIAVGVPIV